MQTSTTGNLMTIILGVVAAAIVGATLTGVRLPLIRSDRAAFFALFVMGFAMCTTGMKLAEYGWLNPFNLAGIVVGTLMLVLVGAVMFRIQVPLITSERTAVIALAGMMVLKVILAVVRGMVY